MKKNKILILIVSCVVVILALVAVVLIITMPKQTTNQIQNSQNSNDIQANQNNTNNNVYQNVIDQLTVAKTYSAYNQQYKEFNNDVNDPNCSYKTSKDLSQSFQYIPILEENPQKYAIFDVNEDGKDELVAMGDNVVLSIYSYDENSGNILFNKDFHGKNAEYGNSQVSKDSIRQNGHIYHTYLNGNNTHYQMKKLNGINASVDEEVTENTGDMAAAVVEGKSQPDYKSKEAAMEAKYPEKTDINWITFTTTDLKRTFSGTLKIQTVAERRADTTAKGKMHEYESKENASTISSISDVSMAAFDLDEITNTICHANGPNLTVCDIGSVLLASTTSNNQKDIDTINKLKDYAGKNVKITFDLTKLTRPGGVTGFGCDVHCSEYISIEEA